MVVQIGKCGLNGTLPLPQFVICGDQSAGKRSILEALTGIPFPSSNILCTRFATEISLRRANIPSLTVKITLDNACPAAKKEKIKVFERSVSNFGELPEIMKEVMVVMSVSKESDPESTPRAFARDVLSIEICRLSNPQLTVVDILGLIVTATKGITKADIEIVAEITDYYIA